MSLSLFDLDRTLIDGYAYARLIPVLWSRGIRRWGIVRLLGRLALARLSSRAPLSSWWPQAFAAYLAGLSPEDLAHVCRVAAAQVRNGLRPDLAQEVAAQRQAGNQLWLVTATVQPLAETVSSALGFDECIATRLALEQGLYSGQIDGLVCRGAEKLERVLERLHALDLGQDLKEVSYYADGKEDLPLLSAVGRPVAVHPDRDLLPVALARGYLVLGSPRE